MDTSITSSAEDVAADAVVYADEATNSLGNGLRAYTEQATNDLRTYVDLGTNFLGVGLRAYTESYESVVIPGVNTTVATNGRVYQVNMAPEGGGSATNVVWPIAGVI